MKKLESTLKIERKLFNIRKCNLLNRLFSVIYQMNYLLFMLLYVNEKIEDIIYINCGNMFTP